ncbi:MAG: hypothetical protein V4496_02595 [Pseudomonadota bacterium]
MRVTNTNEVPSSEPMSVKERVSEFNQEKMHNAVSNVKAQKKVKRQPEVTPEPKPKQTTRPVQEPVTAEKPAEVYERKTRTSHRNSASTQTSPQKSASTPVAEPSLPSKEELRGAYKQNSGFFSFKKHTLFSNDKPVEQIIEKLKSRAGKNPNGASATTLKRFGLS